MDFAFTAEQQAWRKEVRDWLRQELPADWQGSNVLEEGDDATEWQSMLDFRRRAARKGWIAVGWPKEYGGQGRNVIDQAIFGEETTYSGAPGMNSNIGVLFAGPVIQVYGTPEQKREHMPRITSGEAVWCQGFSEPGAGSDLASLQTRAVEDGDDYVVNGSKIWTSFAHRADWCILGTRTDPAAPKHKGITFFLLDMKTPGITIRPLLNMANAHSCYQVFFDNVRIPKRNVLGEVNRGWYVMATTLDFERSGIAGSAGARRGLERLIDYAKGVKFNGRTLGSDPRIAARLAEFQIEINVARMLSYRVAWMQSKGLIPNAEASESKLFASEMGQRMANFGTQLMGLHSQLDKGSLRAVYEGSAGRSYMLSVPGTIAGGSSEIQRNIIASRGLGLPRG
ncbi:MAG: acyl-CoA dehydrogenase family protein [Chloroflexi bacterium]|nr:acyl-CoA dehydrogenase family protein [Chloroflexota bacterium]